MAQLVAVLEDASLVEVYVNAEGQEAYRLTDESVRVGNMLAMVEGEGADAVLEALLPARARKGASPVASTATGPIVGQPSRGDGQPSSGANPPRDRG